MSHSSVRNLGLSKRILVSMVVALFLTGCIGGGDSSSSGGSQPKTVELSESLSLAESETVRLKATGADRLSVPDGVTAISISKVGDGLFEASLGDIDHPVTFILQAVSADGDVLQTSEVEIVNTSATAVIREAELIANQTEAVIALPEDRRFFAYVLDLLYLRGDITESEKTRLLTDYDDRSESWKKSLRRRADYVESTLAEYRNGETGEQVLESATDRFEAEMETAGDINLHNVESIPDSASDFMPELEVTRIHYSDQAKGYTRFHGNSYFGRNNNGSFSFADAYVWLREIAQGSGRVMCNAESAVSS